MVVISTAHNRPWPGKQVSPSRRSTQRSTSFTATAAYPFRPGRVARELHLEAMLRLKANGLRQLSTLGNRRNTATLARRPFAATSSSQATIRIQRMISAAQIGPFDRSVGRSERSTLPPTRPFAAIVRHVWRKINVRQARSEWLVPVVRPAVPEDQGLRRGVHFIHTKKENAHRLVEKPITIETSAHRYRSYDPIRSANICPSAWRACGGSINLLRVRRILHRSPPTMLRRR